MRRYPLCPGCTEEVDTDPIYEAACGHDDTCITLVWHGLCLMEWREHRENIKGQLEQLFSEMGLWEDE